MNNTTTPKQVLESAEKTMINLYGRWQDEKEYEDFADYEKVMREKVSGLPSVTFIKATKRPFGFKFKINEVHFHLEVKVKGRYLQVNVIKD